MNLPESLESRILFGAAFYDEYRTVGSLDRDLDLMVEAHFSVIRVGESVWSTWEPRPGEFNLDWLLPVLDGAHARGIDVILGTPTYAVPPWLRVMHPEIAAHDATGHAVPWGTRQEINFAHPAFRRYAERIIRAVVGRYAEHPAIIGFQVDNEPGLYLLHNPDVFEGFLAHLEEIYGSVDALNRAWGLTYWSHEITNFSQLWTPDGNHSPQYQLEWRRYQSRVVSEFIGWQSHIVREFTSPHHFVTTCISYERPAVDDESLVHDLDVTAGNPYYKMQSALQVGVEVARPEIWWSSGVWGLFEQADRMFGSAQAPFIVTETNAQSIGQSHWQNHPPYPGQIAQAAHALIARGARMIEYWQWQTLHAGIETYWGGVLPHSGEPGRIYAEVAALGAQIKALEPHLGGYVPDHDVTLLYSTDTKRSFEFYPPLARDDGSADEHSYLRIFDAYYRGAFEAGLQSRIIHADQFMSGRAENMVAEHPVLVVPTLYVASDAVLDALVAYARAGGHLVIGIRTGYGDDLARARPERAPARIAEAAGFHYDEYSNLDVPVGVVGDAFGGAIAAGATAWADDIQVDDAEVIASFAGGIYDTHAAVTSKAAGSGRITYVGTVPSKEFARAIMSWAAPQWGDSEWEADSTVTVASGTSGENRVWFVSNWSPETATARPSVVVRSVDSGEIESTVELGPWSVRVFVESLAGTSQG